jgi:hypothetical protein
MGENEWALGYRWKKCHRLYAVVFSYLYATTGRGENGENLNFDSTGNKKSLNLHLHPQTTEEVANRTKF